MLVAAHYSKECHVDTSLESAGTVHNQSRKCNRDWPVWRCFSATT